MPVSVLRVVRIVVAAIAAFAMGFLWYSQYMFGNLWVQAHGYTQADLDAMAQTLGPTYGILFITLLVMGIVLSRLIQRTGARGAAGGAGIGFLCWLGFVATTGLTTILFARAPLLQYEIDAGYQAVYLVAMGAILGAWRPGEAAA
jgi:hypothetical protein